MHWRQRIRILADETRLSRQVHQRILDWSFRATATAFQYLADLFNVLQAHEFWTPSVNTFMNARDLPCTEESFAALKRRSRTSLLRRRCAGGTPCDDIGV